MTTSENSKNKAVRAATHTAFVKHQQNNTDSSPKHQGLSGWHLFEFLKRSFIESNPRCTSTEYDQACYRFARLAGV